MPSPRSAEWLLNEILQRDRFRRPLAAEDRIEQLLDTVGDGSGTTNMATTSDTYLIAPPAGTVYALNRLNAYIEDGINQKFGANLYGALPALTTGIDISVEAASGRLKLLSPMSIQKIGHWGLLTGVDMFFTNFPDSSADMAMVRWTFKKGGGAIWLNGDKGEFLQIIIHDDLSDLVEHTVSVQGFRYVARDLNEQ